MTKRINIIYLITFIVAFCSIVYELLMAQTLSLLTGNSVLRYSTTIGLYLASLGLGAFLCTNKRLVRSVETLWKVEILLSLVGGAAVVLLHFSHMLYAYLMVNLHFTMGLILFFTFSYGIIAVIGILSGFELPLLIHLREQEEERTANLVLGVDYFASLAGAVIFAVVLLPYLGVLRTGFVTAMLNVSVALVLLSYMRGIGRKSFGLFSVCNLSILLALVLSLSFSSGIDQYLLKKYYYARESSESLTAVFSPMGKWPSVERYSSRYQNIDIVTRHVTPVDQLVYASYSDKYENDPSYPNGYSLYLNADCQLSSSVEEIYHEYFAHVPIIANEVPKKILVLGGGDGLLVRELLKYKDVESIILVDIDPEMLKVSTTHPVLRRMNKDSLIDPRVTVKMTDAFYFVKTSKEKYDAIFIDFPVANDYNLSKLYSMEFYSFVRKRLKEDGFAVFDAPGSERGTPRSDWAIYYNTIKAAGFETIVPYLALLEEYGPELYERLNPKLYENFVEEPETIRQMVARRSWYLLNWMRWPFIMMKSEDSAINMEYRDYGVEMYVLNEERYKLTFDVFYYLPETVDRRNIDLMPGIVNRRKVNSIMRPTLPSSSPFTVKVP
ncbi:spermidine synthase [Chloroflexota bacterium]